MTLPPTSILLNATEIRVLGSLIEKEMTTPEYYPMTLNALTNACNQKNNREPVVSFEETGVVRALDSLREKKLVSTVTGAGIRVPKYRHTLTESIPMTREEMTVMCLLLLRGAQTVGELRGRSTSMKPFESLEAVQAVIEGLMKNDQRSSLVARFPRQAGQKEVRYTHLLGTEPLPSSEENTTQPEQARVQVFSENERIRKLEDELTIVKSTLANLQRQFDQFKKQFE